MVRHCDHLGVEIWGAPSHTPRPQLLQLETMGVGGGINDHCRWDMLCHPAASMRDWQKTIEKILKWFHFLVERWIYKSISVEQWTTLPSHVRQHIIGMLPFLRPGYITYLSLYTSIKNSSSKILMYIIDDERHLPHNDWWPSWGCAQ